jgi:preflagellin peptidase FlaK
LAFGFFSTYWDMKKGIIKNKVIVIMLITAAFAHFSTIFLSPSSINLLPQFMLNLGFSIFVGLLLWVVSIWPAGDAKLFIAYSSLIPLDLFGHHGQLFISFDFLINTFVPIFFAMFVFLLIKSKPSEIKKSLKFTFNPYMILMTFIVLAGFMWFIIKAFAFLGVFLNYFTMIIILFVIMEIFNKIVPINMEYIYAFLVILRLILDYRTFFTLGYAYELIGMIFAFVIVRYFVIDLGFYGFTVPKKIEDLEPGMCLAEGIAESKEKGVKYEKKRLLYFSILQALRERGKGKFIHSVSFEGLNKEDVEKLKKLRREGDIPFDDIMIHVKTPFAAFLFIGILLTITFQTNFIAYLKAIYF